MQSVFDGRDKLDRLFQIGSGRTVQLQLFDVIDAPVETPRGKRGKQPFSKVWKQLNMEAKIFRLLPKPLDEYHCPNCGSRFKTRRRRTRCSKCSGELEGPFPVGGWMPLTSPVAAHRKIIEDITWSNAA
jgi:ribosomal protein L37AE/L43A